MKNTVITTENTETATESKNTAYAAETASPDKNCRIRRAAPADIPATLALLTQVNRIHHDIRPDLFELSRKYNEDDLREIFSDPRRPVFVAVDESDAVLGYVFCIFEETHGPLRTECRTLYIDDLCVYESTRGRGIGRALFDHAVSVARAEGCHNVTLHVWEGNDSAAAFYRSMGMHTQYTSLEVLL